jgi:RPA family protein
MKLKYLFPIFFAAIALLISCDEEETMTLLEEIQVSSSYVSLPVDGGSASIKLTAKDSWTIEKVTTSKDPVEWLNISSTSGSSGESDVTFTAEATLDGRTAEVLIKSAGKTQRVNIIQGLAQISEAPVSEVRNGPDGKTFQVSGVVTTISNTEYGNWDLTDETGTIYIYGTLDAKGGTKNFMSLNIEVGDEITVVGPKSTYAGSPQLVNVTVVELRKSLVKVDSVENAALPIEGGEFIAYLTSKGEGVSVEIPEDAKSWLSISSIQSSGENTVIKFKANPNTGGDRGTTIVFSTTANSKLYTTETSITQKGAILEVPISEFLAAEVGDTQYRLTGVIDSIANTKYGNVYIKDFSGEAYVHGIQDYESKNLKVGDIITIVGKRAAYKDAPQVGGAVLEKSIPVTEATVAEVLTKPDSSTDYYMVTGEITKIEDPTYGNVYLKDGDSEIYVYGVYPGFGATGDFRKNLLADKDIKVGDKLTVIATKTTYKDKPQLSNGIYFSHESAE